jgi:hypothetical protein
VHLRLTAAGLLILASATACSDDSPPPSPYCQRLTAVSSQLADAQRDLYSGDDGLAAVTRVVGLLQSALPGAPAEIRRSLAALVTAFQQAQDALANPSKKSQRQLAEAADVLSAQGKKVSDYATSKCG